MNIHLPRYRPARRPPVRYAILVGSVVGGLAAPLIGSLLVLVSAAAQAKTVRDEALAVYHQERVICLSGQSNQDRATCLREAGAALAEARRQGLNTAKESLAGNATKRCEPLPAADRSACMARMNGLGSVSGSVAGGGIVRELVVRETPPASPDKAASDAQAAPSTPGK